MSLSIQGQSAIGSMPRMFQPELNRNMTESQKETVQEIIDKYDAENMTEEEVKSLMEDLKAAGIRPSPELKTMLENAGIELPSPPPPPSMGQQPSGAMGGIMEGNLPAYSSNEVVNAMNDLMGKYQEGNMTDEDLSVFASLLKKNAVSSNGLLVNTIA